MAPISTYRLQIRPEFDLDAAAAVAGYLRDLGVDWAYLSPILQAPTGSDHGYDVTDVTRVDAARGGPAGLARFAAAARGAGLGILIDVVPNHMGVADARQNPWWHDVLAHGRASRHAAAFDIDWEFGGGKVALPVLGAPLDEAIGDLRIDLDVGVLRYVDHVFPLAPGSLDGVDAADVRAVLARQHYTLASWRDEAAVLNYRRFFTVTTLAGVRVEVPEVFDASHAEILRWVREGLADGLRIDHPDGLADPGGYLERLATATRRARGEAVFVVVEKILEHSATDHPEALPGWWRTAGTTGYDALAEFDRVLVDPAGEAGLDALDARLRTESGMPPAPSWDDLVHETKRAMIDGALAPELARLVRTLARETTALGETADAAPGQTAVRETAAPGETADAIAEILACYPVYRSYLPAGREWLDAAVADAARRRPDLAAALTAVAAALADPASEFSRRFQQTAGPVMAKGVEDTAFYRYPRLGTLTEVGGDPAVFALPVGGFHAAQERRQAAWPRTLTALTTHDTKRSEDVRARLSVLAEIPGEWAAALGRFRDAATCGDGPFDALLYQAVVGAWPGDDRRGYAERLRGYAEKSAREAGVHTSWTDPDEAFEARLGELVDTAVASPDVAAFAARITPAGWSNALSLKLLQLTAPGIPDVYQGTELWDLSLVDPDNRRPVDLAARTRLLEELDAASARGEVPPVDATGRAKLLVVSRALRLRRERPELFGGYRAVTAVGAASDHAVAFDRGPEGAVAVATRLPVGLAARGGWGDAAVLLSDRPRRDLLTGRRFAGGEVALADLLVSLPVALLVPEESS